MPKPKTTNQDDISNENTFDNANLTSQDSQELDTSQQLVDTANKVLKISLGVLAAYVALSHAKHDTVYLFKELKFLITLLPESAQKFIAAEAKLMNDSLNKVSNSIDLISETIKKSISEGTTTQLAEEANKSVLYRNRENMQRFSKVGVTAAAVAFGMEHLYHIVHDDLATKMQETTESVNKSIEKLNQDPTLYKLKKNLGSNTLLSPDSSQHYPQTKFFEDVNKKTATVSKASNDKKEKSTFEEHVTPKPGNPFGFQG